MASWRNHATHSALTTVLFVLQVNDFLAGKSPLTLAMRLGDHMMFVQLQLSTSQSSSKRTTTSKHRSVKHVRPAAAHLQPETVSSLVTPPVASAPSPPVVMPVPVHAQPAPQATHAIPAVPPKDARTPAFTCAPRASADTGAPSTKAPAIDSVPVLDSTTLAEASRNLSKKLKELSAASSSHIKTPVDVKQKKVSLSLRFCAQSFFFNRIDLFCPFVKVSHVEEKLQLQVMHQCSLTVLINRHLTRGKKLELNKYQIGLTFRFQCSKITACGERASRQVGFTKKKEETRFKNVLLKLLKRKCKR